MIETLWNFFRLYTADADYLPDFWLTISKSAFPPYPIRFHLQYRKAIKGNAYGREEEIYQCEDGSGCPYAEKCKKGEGNRSVRVNQELTKMHQEVIQNLESIQGALLRMNRSIQAEGTFGIIKNDRWYKRIVRKGIKSVQLEVYLVSLGHNLYKFHNKQMKIKSAA